jgi:hypothetical protein
MPSWTKKRARQHSERRLAKIRDSLNQVLENWAGMDPEVESCVEDAIGSTDDIEEAMNRAVEAEEDEEKQG